MERQDKAQISVEYLFILATALTLVAVIILIFSKVLDVINVINDIINERREAVISNFNNL
ncbi:MAG: hypothetical protein N3D73_01415 [Candidatus Diapherotrites archaeon]|nr:hypothetical protein [Candidatus Diapherotrites archaeon]